MVRFIKLFSYFLCAFLLLSCEADFFDSITEIEIPEHEPQLAIRANFNPTFGERYGYYVRLGHTLGILDTAEYKMIEDATLTLLEDNEIKITFEDDKDNDWYYSETMTLLAGKQYTLRAVSPTYGSLESTQQLPTKVSIIKATYEADAAVNRYGDRGDEVTIQFQDPDGEHNYYLIDITASLRFEGPDTTFISNNWRAGFLSPVDPLLEDFNKLFLTDASFDGEMYTTRISLALMEEGWITIGDAKNVATEKITIRLTSISKDRYLFEKTLSTYQDNQGNPFAEPVVVHENIEGGSGIFTLSITDEFSIEL